MSTAFIDRMQNRAKRFLGVQTNGSKMQPIDVDGQRAFVLVMGIEQAADLRRETGEAGWLTLQKAAITAEGKANPIFKGALGMHNGVVLHETETAIKFEDYGAGANVPAQRALFLGANAASKAYGTKDNGGLRYSLKESGVDHDEEAVIHFRMIMGVKKARYADQDFGIQTLDTAFTPVV